MTIELCLCIEALIAFVDRTLDHIDRWGFRRLLSYDSWLDDREAKLVDFDLLLLRWGDTLALGTSCGRVCLI